MNEDIGLSILAKVNENLNINEKYLNEIQKLKEENSQIRQRIEELEEVIKGLSILFD
jgi:cell division septum initiation protein DivIVA